MQINKSLLPWRYFLEVLPLLVAAAVPIFVYVGHFVVPGEIVSGLDFSLFVLIFFLKLKSGRKDVC